MTNSPTPTFEVQDEDDHVVARVKSGHLTAAFLPGVGGRLISLLLSGRELLWSNPELIAPGGRPRVPPAAFAPTGPLLADWKNPGGDKTWIAPQGWSRESEWPGPPDPVLDSGSYRLDIGHVGGGLSVSMTSPLGAQAGIQISRRFVFPPVERKEHDAGYTIRFAQQCSITNVSADPVRWAIWNVTQIATDSDAGDASAGVLVATPELEADDGFTRLVRAVGELTAARTSEGWFLPAQPVVGKLGFPHASGQISYCASDGTVLEQEWSPQHGCYPDEGSRAEVWMQHACEHPIESLDGLWPRANLVELEVLGPLHTLPAGASSRLNLNWTLRQAGGSDALRCLNV